MNGSYWRTGGTRSKRLDLSGRFDLSSMVHLTVN